VGSAGKQVNETGFDDCAGRPISAGVHPDTCLQQAEMVQEMFKGCTIADKGSDTYLVVGVMNHPSRSLIVCRVTGFG
jgi:hypothetical protein